MKVLEGLRIFLRPMTVQDSGAVHSLLDDREVSEFLSRVRYPLPIENVRKHLEGLNRPGARKKTFSFAIIEKKSEKLIGSVSVKLSSNLALGELGYWLGRDYWGKGYMKEALRLAVGFAFGELRLHRVFAHVFSENVRSSKLLERLGFKREGVLREAVFKAGKWHDYEVFSVLEGEKLKL
jgi:ribosomal-protein-alanine N-acetyltransferase